MLPGFKPMRNILLSSAVQRGADSDARGQINYRKQPFPLLVSDRGEKSGPLGVERVSSQPKQPLCTFLPERHFHLHLFLPGRCCFNPPLQLFPLALSPIFPIFISTSHLQPCSVSVCFCVHMADSRMDDYLPATDITDYLATFSFRVIAVQGHKTEEEGGKI